MNSIENVKKVTCAKADNILNNGPDTLAYMKSVLEKHFQVVKLSEIEKLYETELEGDPDGANASLIEAILAFSDVISLSMDHIQTLERFISLHVPQMEDGNNFGVTVQLTISKFLDETRESLGKQLETIPVYYSGRAEAVEKLGYPKSTVSETKSVTTSQSTGGKDGDENKSSSTTTKEEKTASIGSKKIIDYRRKHMISLDVQCYGSLRYGLVDCYDSYLTILDNMEKNKEKLLEPKGRNGGPSMGMY